jgi:mannosylglycerate hydrolase
VRRRGAAAPPVLYSPDAFGHAAALPTIATGFGLPVAIVWRGYGGRRWPAGDVARWEASDGSGVLLYHLPPSGYELGSNLPPDDAGAADWWTRHRTLLADRASLGLALLPNGADHHALQERADEALAALRVAAADEAEVRRATLGDFARALVDGARGRTLPTVRGELRDSYGYTWTLQGTLATRAAQKRNARLLERALVRDVEPWLALGPAGAEGSVRAALDEAWRTLLRCYPHDTLCGCSIDLVAAAMDARLASGAEQARGLRTDALYALMGHEPVAARTRRSEWQPVLVVRNAAARPRAGLVTADLDAFVADVPVGPGSRPASPTRRTAPLPPIDGGRYLVQRLDELLVHDRTESPRHYPDCDLVRRARVLLWCDEPVDALGTRTLPLGGRGASAGSRALEAPPVLVTGDARSLDNGLLRLEVDDAGRVTLATESGARFVDLLGIESVGDVGDTYTQSPVGEVSRAWRFVGARLEQGGPLRGTLALRYTLRLPLSRTRTRAARRVVVLPLVLRLSLDAMAPYLRIAVDGENRARDHRLRLAVRTGVRDAACWADAGFGAVARTPLDVPPEDRMEESVPTTAPLHRYVSLFDAHAGATLYADGLAEYEATTDGELLVTLVRAVGELSRNDLPERPGHAGWPTPTPAAQCAGPFTAHFALLPHGPREDAVVHLVEQVADDVLLPLRATTLRSALALPAPTVGPMLEGEGLALSAVKPADDEAGWIVLRCVNLLDRAVEGRWTVASDVTEVWRARLDETPLTRLDVRDGVAGFVAAPREVVTLRLRRP